MAHWYNCLTSNNVAKSAFVAGGFVGAVGAIGGYGLDRTSRMLGFSLEKINDQTRFQPMTVVSGGAGLAVVESLATSALARLPGCKEYKRFLNAATCALFEGAALWYLGVNSQKIVQCINKQIACYALISLTVSCAAKQLPQTKNWADLVGIVGRACTATYFSTLWPNSSLVALSALRQVFFISSELYPLLKNWHVTLPQDKENKPVITRHKTPTAPPLTDIHDKIEPSMTNVDNYTFNGVKYYEPYLNGADDLIRKCRANGCFKLTDYQLYTQIEENGQPCSVWRLQNVALSFQQGDFSRFQRGQLNLLKK